MSAYTHLKECKCLVFATQVLYKYTSWLAYVAFILSKWRLTSQVCFQRPAPCLNRLTAAWCTHQTHLQSQMYFYPLYPPYTHTCPWRIDPFTGFCLTTSFILPAEGWLRLCKLTEGAVRRLEAGGWGWKYGSENKCFLLSGSQKNPHPCGLIAPLLRSGYPICESGLSEKLSVKTHKHAQNNINTCTHIQHTHLYALHIAAIVIVIHFTVLYCWLSYQTPRQ